MKITLTGASGFIGGQLVKALLAEGHELTVAGRRDPKVGRFFSWDGMQKAFPAEAVEGADAVIHLAGEPVAQRWSAEVKQKIRDSRINGTTGLVRAMRAASEPPKVLVAASAIGFYGDRGDELLTERSKPGTGFLPEVCVEWETTALVAENMGVRVVLPRIGIVLHKSGGALAEMLTPFKLGVGGPVGGGKQWMSWIHRDDLVSLLLWALHSERAQGPVNAVSPNPCRNEEFAECLGSAVSRPAVVPTPAFALKLMFGEMAGMLLSSQRIVPSIAKAAGFSYRYADLGEALRAAVADGNQ